jgi:MarR family transcriptional regulator, lower aerobic nicotinate degradation pathway regulator
MPTIGTGIDRGQQPRIGPVEEVGTQLPDDLMESPVFLMVQLTRMARRRAEGIRRGDPDDNGVRLPHYAVLSILRQYGPASQREVADRLHFDASDVVGMIDMLEDKGYVSRLRDPSDRRRYKLTATPSGLVVLEEINRKARHGHGDFLSPLTPDERATLKTLLLKLYEHHHAIGRE